MRVPPFLSHVSWIAALPLLAILGGCDDPALERGTPPPIVLDQQQVYVPLFGYAAARRLRREIGELAPDGRVARLDAAIRTSSLPLRDATRGVLIQAGIDPARITWNSQTDGGDIVVLTRTTAVTVPCGAALKSDWQGDVGNSITSLGTCVQANNLAEMLVDPRDLAKPVKLGPTNGAVAARAVRDWENGGAREPSRSDVGGSAGSDDAGAGYATGGQNGSVPAGPALGGGLGTQAADQPSRATVPPSAGAAANPLLSPIPAPDLSGN